MRSIEVGVGLRLTAVCAAFALACAVLMSYQLSNVDETARRLRLEEQAGALRQLLRLDRGGVHIDLPAAQAALYASDDAEQFYAVSGADGAILSSSRNEIAARLRASPCGAFRPGVCVTAAIDGEDGALYLLTQPVARDGTTLFLTVAHRPWTSDRLLRQVETALLVQTALAGLPLCLCAFGLSLLVLRKGLAPVQTLSRQAAAIGPANPGARLAHPRLPDELIDLVAAANGAADRLEGAVTDQRRFTAEAAHQLLTPLAILSARLEEERPTGMASATQRDLERMERLIRQLLSLSGATFAAEPPSNVDLGNLAREVIVEMVPLFIASGRRVAYIGPTIPCVISGMPLALREALGNLIHNSLQHSQPGDCVQIEVREPATVTVSNPGPAIPKQDLPHLFKPFFTTRAGKGGSGLGLSVVDAVAKCHDGSVAIYSQSGQNTFALTLCSGTSDASALIHMS